MKNSATLLLLSIGLSVQLHAQATRTATASAQSRAVYISNVSAFVFPLGEFFTFFTSFDGTANLPAENTHELRPRPGVAGVYETDYRTYSDPNGANLQEYGNIRINLPTTDSDANGLPDWMQGNLGIDTGITGTIIADATGDNTHVNPESLTGNFQRSAGSASGTFVFTFNFAGSLMSYQGNWGLPNFSGSISYTRSPNQMVLTYNFVDPVGSAYEVKSTNQFTVLNANQIQLPQHLLVGPNNIFHVVNSTVLTRFGNRYVGNIQFQTNSFSTAAPDFITWYIEIVDAVNDTDGDSIPDLSDSFGLAPSIITPPATQSVNEGTEVNLTVEVSADPAPTYQWFLGDNPLFGKTNATLSFPSIAKSDAGVYKVFIQNSAGSITSDPAVITVNSKPTIAITSPVNNQVLAANVFQTITVTTADPENSIARVEYILDDINIATNTVPPYSLTRVFTAGAHLLQARIVDTFGATNISATVAFTARANNAPSITITQPTQNQIISASQPFTATVNASDANNDLSHVIFLLDGTPVRTNNLAPYSLENFLFPAGNHILSARAVDTLGAESAIASVGFFGQVNANPTISITSPTSNQKVKAEVPFQITVNQADSDGSVVRVEYFLNGSALATST
ncbi:MAG: Ig-like domain-containing protein, partial [Verrucomicrobiota bacterium]|nr:Ig-like domain-containing protein [Verrucomicrobiota bacterium]